MIQITEQLRQIITTHLDVEVSIDDISAETQLMGEGLALDSIAIIELITSVEDTFNVQLSEDDLDMEKFSTINSLAQLIASKQAVPA